MSARAWVAAAAVLIAAYVALVLTAAARKSETWDEPTYAATGTAMVLRGETERCQEFFPTLPWLAGASLALAGADLPTPPSPFVRRPLLEWLSVGPEPYMLDFFYRNRLSHDRALFFARLPTVVCGALAGVLVWTFCRRRLGEAAALVALGVTAFTPEMLAESQWATHDVPAALTLVAVALALLAANRRPGARDAVLGGLLGLALATKLTAVVLVPVVVLGVATEERAVPSLRRLLVVAAAAWLVLLVTYLPHADWLPPHGFEATDVRDLCGDSPGAVCRAQVGLLRWAPLPDAWLRSAALIRGHERRGHPTYLAGRITDRARPAYALAVLAFKFPPAWLLLALVGGGTLAWARTPPLDERIALGLTPLLVLLGGIRADVLWARHFVPLAPFVGILAGRLFAAARGQARWAVAGLAIASAASGATAYPHFLSYFSLLGGGTAHADRWLSDSNLDWGQDLAELPGALRRHRVTEVALAYFGTARPEHYGIHTRPPLEIAPGWYAVSRTLLVGLYRRGDPYAWLRGLAPVEVVGGSIALYSVDAEQAEAAHGSYDAADVPRP